MKILFRLLIAFVLATMLAPAFAKATGRPPHTAEPVSWTGIGTQTQRGVAPSHWRIHLTVDKSGNARIDYPTLHCGGVLTRLGHAGNVVKFREHLRYGHRICVDNGTVTTWRRGNRLIWRWTGERTKHPAIRAKATLVLSRHRGR